ncbi:McrC family protein [Clostridium sp.]|uniref:McrC family protein n=1 Tax=Clostridium sp. TaxID=1506 RepID=UPI003D6D342C
MRHITIQECYDNLVISDTIGEKTITQKEADELNKYVVFEKLDRENVIWGRDTVTFINYVGYIKLSTVDIEILPKISINKNDPEMSRKALLNMLSRCGILSVKYSDISSLNIYKMNLNEILSFLFAQKLQRELTKGPYQEYVYVEENSDVLKGSLLVQQHIKNLAACTPKAFCRYEDFSMDNVLNQILSYCVRILITYIKNPETIKLLRHAQAYFAEVTERELSNHEIVNYTFNRLNSRFEQVFILAKMIIMGHSSLASVGGEKTYSILFKMNDVFEKYITKLLSMNLEDSIVHVQHSKYKLLVNEDTNNSIFRLLPDIVIEKDGVESIIIDTKWKRVSSGYNRHGVKRDDIYQMYAYLTRYPNVKTVILLYPHNEEVERKDKRYLESWYLDNDKSKKIRAYTIDLESEEITNKCLNEIIRDIE